MKTDDFLKRIDDLLEMGEKALATRHPTRSGASYIDSGPIKGFRTASLSFIKVVYGDDHPHYQEFSLNTNGFRPSDARMGISILQSIRSEIEGGWLFSLKGLITAELFANFIEMSEHLLETGYKDPAAVVCGSVLEEHLRQLCSVKNIPTEIEKDGKLRPIKADKLNSDLTKQGVYSKLDQKMVTAWLDLRNNAAHGQYDKYNQDQVKNMITAVTEFMSRVAV